LGYGTTYYWQVRARNSFGTSYADKGTWWSFTTKSAPAAFDQGGSIPRKIALALENVML